MYVHTSTSGAHIITHHDVAVKVGDGEVGARIDAQADWLVRHASDGMMPVLSHIGSIGYVMPYGDPWPDFSDATRIFNTVVGLLQTHVWNRDAEFVPNIQDAVLCKFMSMHGRVDAVRMWELHTLIMSVTWMDLPQCLTHGDPTFCNALFIDVDKPVLCDPLPSVITRLPDVRAMDLGKLLQSCFGFESIVYGWRYSVQPNAQWVRALCENENEWHAAIACGALHVLRLLPYVSPDLREEFEYVFDEILRLRPGRDLD